MRLKQWIVAGMLMMAPALVFGQENGKGKGHGKGKKHKTEKQYKVKEKKYKVKDRNDQEYYGKTRTVKNGPPPWAPAHGYRAKQHVYFPDYYTFYDPNRGGYVYWNDNRWLFSSNTPTFLNSVDLGKARVQLISDIPLTTRPETNYTRYHNLYPARTVNIVVPVPNL